MDGSIEQTLPSALRDLPVAWVLLDVRDETRVTGHAVLGRVPVEGLPLPLSSTNTSLRGAPTAMISTVVSCTAMDVASCWQYSASRSNPNGGIFTRQATELD